MRLKMQWKILIGVLVSGVACGGVLIFANADSSVSLSLTPAQSSVIQGSTSTVIHANLSGTDDEFYDASNPSNNGIASPVRLEWTISDEDYDVVKFVNPSSGGDAYLQTVSGTTNPTVYGNRAGAATITAAYHSKKFQIQELLYMIMYLLHQQQQYMFLLMLMLKGKEVILFLKRQIF